MNTKSKLPTAEEMMDTDHCKTCGTKFTLDNRYPSDIKINRCICKTCHTKRSREWYHNHRYLAIARAKISQDAKRRKHGMLSFTENEECASFLGVHVAERVLSHVFKDVEMMPMHNPGYDFICNRGKKIDVKSSCLRKNGNGWNWGFTISRNTVADYFLCLAFDNRADLNPLHVWFIPKQVINYLVTASISVNTVHKWDEFRLDISKISTCCDILRGV